jgi:NAD(P)-dependent dehydrogenase (short-subunit alcohol dehydrogenase family)
VVNNAGIFVSKPFTDYTDDDYDAVTGVNLRGFFELSRAAVRAMVAQGEGGHVVNVSTSLVDHANSRVPAALASLTKGGLNAVTKALAVEFADRGIRANAVALGIIRTPMHDPASYDALAEMHPLRRLGEIDDVVDAVVYLENAPFVTGEILHVDGGQSAGH